MPLQRTAAELLSAVRSMFRVRAVESPPDDQGCRTIWHRGAKGADVVTFVDGLGRVMRQELTLFSDYFLWERGQGLKTGLSAEIAGAAQARSDVEFDQAEPSRRKRVKAALEGFGPYEGEDRLLLHLKNVLTLASEGREMTGDEPVTRPQERLDVGALAESGDRTADERARKTRFWGALIAAGVVVALLGAWLMLR